MSISLAHTSVLRAFDTDVDVLDLSQRHEVFQRTPVDSLDGYWRPRQVAATLVALPEPNTTLGSIFVLLSRPARRRAFHVQEPEMATFEKLRSFRRKVSCGAGEISS